MKAKTTANPELNQTNPGRPTAKVDAFLKEADKWQEEMKRLRAICLSCGLTEELKWGKPCYMLNERNILIIQPFKEYCALMFCKGALLKDPRGLLVKPGEHTQGARQMRFTGVQEIVKLEPVMKAYINEAIAAEKAGVEVVYKKTPEPTPKELQDKFDDSPAFKAAFKALTPGRQRAYILFISAAKQSPTRVSRIAKCLPQILKGKGLNE